MIKVTSPLTQSDDVSLIQTISTDHLIKQWKSTLNIDISEDLKGYQEIYLYQCNQTKLHFFIPLEIAGSDQLYEKLGELDWYYMKEKWEYDMASQDINLENKVLEVGSGKGEFIKRLRKKGIDAYGIELNREAVAYSNRHNIPIKAIDLYDLANSEPNNFDVVCSFQVLEHIAEPKHFLDSIIKLLRPKGKLIISVPNQDAMIKHNLDNILEMPPHHVTRWKSETFERLITIFPLKLLKISYEPLALYHVDWYISIFKYRYSKFTFKGLIQRLFFTSIAPVLKRSTFIRNFIKGHTMYVVYEKQ